MKEIIEFNLTEKQDKAWEHLVNNQNNHVLWGGAKGGGKTFLFCLWAFHWARKLAAMFNLKETNYPLPVGFIGRKRSVDFTHTTLETWKQIIPSGYYRIKEQVKEIVITNQVKLLFGGLDDESVVQKFNSAEYAFFGIDQAEETTRDELSVLQASLRLVYQGIVPPYKRLYTANPRECWLKEDFITNPRSGYIYIPALPTDNPHLPESYINTLEEAFKHDPVLLKAYKEGDWDILQDHATVITQTQLERLKNKRIFRQDLRKLVACDPAIGGDECVLYYLENEEIKDRKILHINDTQKIGAEAVSFMNEYECDEFALDAIGIGKGVGDYVRGCGKQVHEIISSQTAEDTEHFANVRAEMWANFADLVISQEIPYPEDEMLRRQLVAVKHKQGAKKFQLAPKELTKKDLGQSPDRADAYVLGLYILPQVKTESEKKWEKTDAYDEEPVGEGFMAC
jgi:hypothetical protein